MGEHVEKVCLGSDVERRRQVLGAEECYSEEHWFYEKNHRLERRVRLLDRVVRVPTSPYLYIWRSDVVGVGGARNQKEETLQLVVRGLWGSTTANRVLTIRASCRPEDTWVTKAHVPPPGACDSMISTLQLSANLQHTENFN